MWPFRKKEEKRTRWIKKLVVGVMIGSAIGTVVGSKILEQKEKEKGVEEDESE